MIFLVCHHHCFRHHRHRSVRRSVLLPVAADLEAFVSFAYFFALYKFFERCFATNEHNFLFEWYVFVFISDNQSSRIQKMERIIK